MNATVKLRAVRAFWAGPILVKAGDSIELPALLAGDVIATGRAIYAEPALGLAAVKAAVASTVARLAASMKNEKRPATPQHDSGVRHWVDGYLSGRNAPRQVKYPAMGVSHPTPGGWKARH